MTSTYVCQVCFRFAAPNFKATLRHIGAVHSHDSNFNVLCGIEECPRTFLNYHSFRRHIRDKHAFMLDSAIHRDDLLPEPVTDHEIETDTSLPEAVSTTVDTQPSVAGPQDTTSTTGDPDTVKKSEAIHVLKLKELYKLAQSTVDNIIGDVEEITANIVSRLQESVTDLLTNHPDATAHDIAELFEDPSLTPFRGLKTEFRQDKFFRESLGLVVSAFVWASYSMHE